MESCGEIGRVALCTALFIAGVIGLPSCAVIPKEAESKPISGTVIEKSSGKPVPNVLVYAELSSTYNKTFDGGAGEKWIVAKNYGISDDSGHFEIPAFSGMTVEYYENIMGTRKVVGPCCEVAAEEYFREYPMGSEGFNPPVIYVKKVWKDTASMHFGRYLDGERKLEFRKNDYPKLLVLLNAWNKANQRSLSEKDKELYAKYYKQFTQEN